VEELAAVSQAGMIMETKVIIRRIHSKNKEDSVTFGYESEHIENARAFYGICHSAEIQVLF
jgi:hypothetical protein